MFKDPPGGWGLLTLYPYFQCADKPARLGGPPVAFRASVVLGVFPRVRASPKPLGIITKLIPIPRSAPSATLPCHLR